MADQKGESLATATSLADLFLYGWDGSGDWKVPADLIAAGRQLARNGSLSVAQRGMPTADNAYGIDGWRLLIENANGVVLTQDSADVPDGAGFAAKLVVGSGNNGKFGLFSPIENRDARQLRNKPVSLRVPLKATAGLVNGTGKIRVGILAFTGTADAVSGDPVSSWGAEGTNPTLAADWAFANTPAAIAVTTSWADYVVENVTIPANATNIAILIWSDDRATTTTTDILRIGGYVTLTRGAVAPPGLVLPFAEELARCQRYFQKTFPLATAPADGAGTAGAMTVVPLGATGYLAYFWQFPRMRTAPTIATYNPGASGTSAYWRNAGDTTSSQPLLAGVGENCATIYLNNAVSKAWTSEGWTIHATADADM